MIDYQKASDAKLTTVATEYNEYAYENVIVAICELRARSIAIPQAAVDKFCEKYRLDNIDAGINDFLKSNRVTSYKDYCKEAFFETRLAKPQQPVYQKRVREWDASTLPNAESGDISIIAANRSLKRATGFAALIAFLGIIYAIYWHSKFLDLSEGRTTLDVLYIRVAVQSSIMTLNFIALFYHLGKARTMLRGA